MKTKILTLVLVLVLAMFLGITSVVLANDGLELSRWVLGGGVSDSCGSDITLKATLGQPVVGIVSFGDLTMGQGFWNSYHHSEALNDIYLPLVQR